MEICAIRGDGLGTRIQTILQAAALSRHFCLLLNVVWPPIGAPYFGEERMPAHELVDLFNSDYILNVDGHLFGRYQSDESYNFRNVLHVSDLIGRHWTSGELKSEFAPYDCIVYDTPYQILSDEEMGISVVEEIRRLWKCFDWSNNFLKKIDAVRSGFDLAKCIAIHARRGDIMEMLRVGDLEYLRAQGMEQLLQRFVARKTFVDRIVAMKDMKSIIICGEDVAFASSLSAEPQLKGYKLFDTLAFSDSETERAFIDFFILAEAGVIVAPFHSYFSGAASLVGGSSIHRIELNIPDVLEELFDVVENSPREDKKEVKALMCETFARMIRS